MSISEHKILSADLLNKQVTDAADRPTGTAQQIKYLFDRLALEVVIPALNAQTFDISDAVVNRDFEKALFKLQELYAMQTDPIAVLGAIGAQLRRLYYARVILSAGGGQKELMELTGLRSYPAGLTMTAARRVTDGFCQRAIELALDTDIAMKTSADEPERLLELLIVRLAQEAQHG